jgi:hypothetical protein
VESLSTAQAADVLGVCRGTLHLLAVKGLVTPERTGRCRRWTLANIRAAAGLLGRRELIEEIRVA